MGEDDRYRIEPRLRGMQRGIAPQPEDIDLLRERQREGEKLSQKPPSKPFESYLAAPDEQKPVQQQESERQEQGAKDEGSGEQLSEADKVEENRSEPDSPKMGEQVVIPQRAQQMHQAQQLAQQLQQQLDKRQASASQRTSFFEADKPPPPRGRRG
jgi:hypothetical protein